MVTLGLFLVWSNSFVAVSYLLGREGVAAQLDWVTLSVSRFSISGVLCGVYCMIWRRRESLEMLRRSWGRLLVCGFFAVPVYNLGLYYGQQHGVTPPVASLTTTLVPLFVMILSVTFLGEALTVRRVVGFLVAAVGLYLVATARGGGLDLSYPWLLAITALGATELSIVTVISKPLTVLYSPIVWSYMATAVGSLMVLPFFPGETYRQLTRLDTTGWLALLYLAVPCVIGGFAV